MLEMVMMTETPAVLHFDRTAGGVGGGGGVGVV